MMANDSFATSDNEITQEEQMTSAAAPDAPAEAAPVEDIDSGSDDSSDGAGGSDDGADGSDGAGDLGDGDDEGAAPLQSATADMGKDVEGERVMLRMKSFLKAPASTVSNMTGSAYGYLSSGLSSLLQVVPAPVLVALISLVSTISGARYKARRDQEATEETKRKVAKEKKHEIERHLRKTYMELAAPILKSAAKLAERIHVLVDSEWEAVEKTNVDDLVSPAYSAYLLGRYLATVEIIKQDNLLLDYGFPAADRILANILGRVQGVLSANDGLLIDMQKYEHLFQPPPGKRPLRGGPLRITPRAQTVLGELLFRKLYSGKVHFVDRAENENRGPRAVISFLEFSRLLRQDATLARWYKPVIQDFRKLESSVRRLPRNKRRSDMVGARLYFLQSGLLDLVEFFDPLPHAQAVPFYRRRRLQLGGLSLSEEQRAPPSLHLLYRELANIRDHRVVEGNAMDRLRLPDGGVEVHVKAAQTEHHKDGMPFTKHGDCPYSQRVLIVLEELGVPYKKVFISTEAKPAWFYLLHPEKRTPVVYHDGTLVEDSKHIVSYVLERFKPAAGKLPLASASKLQLAVGTAAFTRFHDYFIAWLGGNEHAKADMERELRKLDRTVGRAQMQNETGAFLGGERFAREDTAIAPMLNNVEVAGRSLKQWEIPEGCVALKRYLEAARKVSSFVKTVGDEKAIVAGYGSVAGTVGERSWRLADMLE